VDNLFFAVGCPTQEIDFADDGVASVARKTEDSKTPEMQEVAKSDSIVV
jgi:hypothetical protein